MSAEHEEYEEKDFTEPDNVNAGLVGTITVVGAILVLSIALALTALVRSEVNAHSEKVNAFANLGTVTRLKAEQVGKLEAAPAWADQAKGVVSLPIGRAMELTTADIQKDPALATKAVPGAEEEEPAPDGGADGAAPAAAGEGEGSQGAAEAAPKVEETAEQDEKKPGQAEGAGELAPKAPAPKGKQPKKPKGAVTPPAAPAPAPGTEN